LADIFRKGSVFEEALKDMHLLPQHERVLERELIIPLKGGNPKAIAAVFKRILSSRKAK
jgi:hypothetical protein